MRRASSATINVTMSKRMSNCTCSTRPDVLVPLLNALAIIMVLTSFDSLYPLTKKEGKMARISLEYTHSELFCIERNLWLLILILMARDNAPEQAHVFPNYPILPPKGNGFLMYFRLSSLT